MPETAYIGIGSNLGDRQAYLQAGLEAVAALPGIRLARVSSVYETAPMGYTEQPFFLNAVLAVEASIPAQQLLDGMQAIEAHHERQRTVHWGPRTLDLDLLLFGDHAIDTDQLRVPHPHMAARGFVLGPLCEIAPELRHPGTGRLFCSYYGELSDDQQVWPSGRLEVPSE